MVGNLERKGFHHRGRSVKTMKQKNAQQKREARQTNHNNETKKYDQAREHFFEVPSADCGTIRAADRFNHISSPFFEPSLKCTHSLTHVPCSTILKATPSQERKSTSQVSLQ